MFIFNNILQFLRCIEIVVGDTSAIDIQGFSKTGGDSHDNILGMIK